MTEKNIFWCEQCQKKYFLDEKPQGIELSNIQKKVPFLDFETQKKTKPVFLKRDQKYKCQNCGFFMKEIKNVKRNNPS